MGTTLDNGIYLPDEGERNCYEGLAGNWVALDNHLGSTNIHVTINDKQAWDSHVADTTIHVTSADKEAWNGKADNSALTAHTGDTTIHVTAEDKQAWNGKQDALSQTQLDAVNSGIDSTKVQQIVTNTSDISSLQSGKANNSDVVHKSGNETVDGKKTFTDNLTASKNATNGAIYLQNLSYDPKTNGQSNAGSGSFSIGFNTLTGDSFAFISAYGSPEYTMLRFTTTYFTDSENSITDSIEYRIYPNGDRTLRPRNQNNCTLGETSKRWKDVNTYLVNGLTPSSLSLPGLNNAVDISGYITDLAGSPNIYSPPANGYIILRSTTANVLGIVENTTGMGLYSRGSNQLLAVYLPVVKNSSISIYAICSNLTHAKFIPCLGNI